MWNIFIRLYLGQRRQKAHLLKTLNHFCLNTYNIATWVFTTNSGLLIQKKNYGMAFKVWFMHNDYHNIYVKGIHVKKLRHIGISTLVTYVCQILKLLKLTHKWSKSSQWFCSQHEHSLRPTLTLVLQWPPPMNTKMKLGT